MPSRIPCAAFKTPSSELSNFSSSALEINADKLPKIYIRTGSVTQISYFENWASLVYSDYVPL